MISVLTNPQNRQWLYTIASVASSLVPLLVIYKIIDAESADAWLKLIGVLGGLGTAGTATAAVVTSRQRKEGTLDFTGTADEQAVAAIQYVAERANDGVSRLQKVIQAASQSVPPNPVSTNSDPASANYQP